MIRTRVGYSGGTTESPTYTSIGDHSESIQIDFDPTVVSFAELLDLFWESHHPEDPPYCRQYMSGIFYHDEAQRLLAVETKQGLEAEYGTIHTEIAAVQTFYRAEDYHQKFYLNNSGPLMAEFNVFYPDPIDFTDSTAAARVNAVMGHTFTAARLAAEIDSFGLSEESNEILRSRARN